MKKQTKQRFRLAEQFQKGAAFYHATFDHITHKTNRQHKKIPVILLTDLYFVNEQGKKVQMRKDIDFKDKRGRHIIADHIWIKMTKPWFELPYELVQGDEITFSAEVEQYKITRKDVLAKREEIFQAALKKNDQIWKRWSNYTDKHKRKNFQLSLNKMKEKQKRNLEEAKKEQAKLELVDYSLNKISKIKVVKKAKTKKSYAREKYNYNYYKTQGYKYTAWLAARSMDYVENKS